jgi:hypothetical protein
MIWMAGREQVLCQRSAALLVGAMRGTASSTRSGWLAVPKIRIRWSRREPRCVGGPELNTADVVGQRYSGIAG